MKDGVYLRKIYFHCEDELMYFCELLFQKEKKIHLHWENQSRHKNELTILQHVPDDSIKACMIQLFMQFRFHRMMKEIIQDTFHYDKDEEVEAIKYWTDWVITANIHHERLYKHHETFQKFLRPLFSRYIFDRTYIHFDEMCLFSRQEVKRKMTQIVGYAIDEWKEEERYQHFIHAIRVYIQSRPSKIDEIHILHEDTFQFFTYRGEKIVQEQIEHHLEKEPLYLFGIDTLEYDVTPVITFLPKQIYVYTDDLADTKVTALRNIFEEKVTPLQKKYFPFRVKEN